LRLKNVYCDMTKPYALVTGSSSGIGFQFARGLAARGYDLVMVSNEDEPLKLKAEEIRSEYGVDVIAITADLAVQDAAKSLHDRCHELGLEIEVLVNNAGIYHDRDFLDDSVAFNTAILNLHVFTPAMLEYYFGQDMVSRCRGRILNMSSVTSDFSTQRLATYSSTKAFLKYFSRSTHIELKHKGVTVTCVRPGAVATNLYNLKPLAIRIGLIVGYIITPERLAKRGLNALFHGRAQITPGLFSKLLILLVKPIPTGVLCLVRRLKIF